MTATVSRTAHNTDDAGRAQSPASGVPVPSNEAEATGTVDGGETGRLRDPHNTSSHLRQALDRAGFDWVSSHVFRKTVATRLDEAGLSARQIADHLGHNRPSLTQDVYMGRGLASPEAATALQRSR
jgi:integrase